MAIQEIPASAEKQSVPQETPLQASSSSSNYLPLTPITIIDDNYTCQDPPLPNPDQLEQLFRHLELDPYPYFHPSASNHVPLPAATAGSLVSSINGETDSSPSSGVSYGALSQQEPPPLVLNQTFWNPKVPRGPPQLYRLNVAVVLCIEEGIRFLGLAAVVRDSNAIVQQAMTLVWDPNLNPNLDFAEFYILDLGIRLCLAFGYRRLIAETQAAVWLVRRYRQIFNLGLFDFFETRRVSANDNRLARAFAAMALQIENILWTPEQIVHIFGSLRLPQ